MDRILHDVDNAHKILQLTSDTLILVDKNGTCLDIDPHSDLWFLQEDRLLGKNLFNLLPDHTFQKLLPDFRRVTQQGITVNRNYRLPLEGAKRITSNVSCSRTTVTRCCANIATSRRAAT